MGEKYMGLVKEYGEKWREQAGRDEQFWVGLAGRFAN